MALPLFENFHHRGFHKDDQIQHFMADHLTYLERKSNGCFISNPITPLATPTKNIKKKHLLCFPSAVIEIKHHKVTAKERTKCYCQAANGASTALALLSRLSHFSIPIEDFSEMQPVVAFTFVGYRSRVWIAYVANREWEDGNIRCEYVSLSSLWNYFKRHALILPGNALHLERRSAPCLGHRTALPYHWKPSPLDRQTLSTMGIGLSW